MLALRRAVVSRGRRLSTWTPQSFTGGGGVTSKGLRRRGFFMQVGERLREGTACAVCSLRTVFTVCCASFCMPPSSQAGESCECGCVLAVSLSPRLISSSVRCVLSLSSLAPSPWSRLSPVSQADLLTSSQQARIRSRIRSRSLVHAHTRCCAPQHMCHSSAAILLSPSLRLTLCLLLSCPLLLLLSPSLSSLSLSPSSPSPLLVSSSRPPILLSLRPILLSFRLLLLSFRPPLSPSPLSVSSPRPPILLSVSSPPFTVRSI